MNIVLRSWKDFDYLMHQEMEIDGKNSLSVHPLSECPEDAIIGRDLVSCDDVINYMRRAYEAGKRGEEFNVKTVEGNPDNE